PVSDLLSSGVPVTLKLGFYALLLALAIGIPIGLYSAIHQNSAFDYLCQGSMMIFYAVPTFVLAPIMQLVFGVNLHWFPVQGWGDNLREIIMPVFVYGIGLAGYFAKSFRSFMLEVLQQDYIRTARAKGLSQRIIIW